MSGPVDQASRPIVALDAGGIVAAPPGNPPNDQKTEPDGFDRGRAWAEEKHKQLEDIYAALSRNGYGYDDFGQFLIWRDRKNAGKGQGEKPDVRHGFKLLRADELEMRAPVYLVDPIIETDSTGQFFGDVEAFKTLLVVGMGCCVATGTAFFGMPVRKGLVVLIIGEGGGGIARRLKVCRSTTGSASKGNPYTFRRRPRP